MKFRVIAIEECWVGGAVSSVGRARDFSSEGHGFALASHSLPVGLVFV